MNYLGNRQYPALLGESLFPEVKRNSLRLDMIKGAKKVPVIASVHAFDTEAEIGSREATKDMLELALIKRKLPMSEEDIVALENPRTPAEQQYLMSQVFNDFEFLVNGVKARVELMRMEVLASGTVTLDENNLKATLNYGVPAENKEILSGTDLWSDPTSDPLEQMLAWYSGMAIKPKRVLTSLKVLATLLRHPKVVSALYGSFNTSRIASRAELNNYLTQLELPTIAVNDAVYRKEVSKGVYEQRRYFPEDKFVMLPDGPLGETVYGPTAEEIRLSRNPQVDITKVGNILAMVYEENKDPVTTYTKAVATALPSFPVADEVFQAKVL
ncbi:major capsid protein [Paenibacillus chitinolyticus]|uniref:major capsid protein n=1 Tax=Paenibacillus chitinolyticus TaxID=79263 RepID=UPI0036733680